MMKKFLLLFAVMLFMGCSSRADEPSSTAAKTLVVYYSYTGNCRDLATMLKSRIQADVLEIQPAQKGLKYDANGYALGTQLLNAINANPNDASSYPDIDPVTIAVGNYDNIIIVTPLWWSQMAAIMQSFLFNYGPQMAGKHVAMIVSSHSSGISGVESDAKRLLPNAVWMGDALWINNSNRSNAASLIENWVSTLNFATEQTTMDNITITIDGQSQRIKLVDNAATRALVEKLKQAPVTVTLNSSGGFEIWGALGFSLPTSDEQITARPGDVVLYNGSNICLFYGSNPWSYTRLGKIEGLADSELRSFLKAGQSNITVTLSLASGTNGIAQVRIGENSQEPYYTLSGQRITKPSHGIFIHNGKKVKL